MLVIKSLCRSKLVKTACITVAVAIAVIFWYPQVKIDSWFSKQLFPIEYYWLYDLGVVDANNDGILDVFTTNHNARQSLLLGSGSEEFTDVLSQWRLDQDLEFPGLEESDAEPPIDAPGLYIYRSEGEVLNIRNHDIDPVSGWLELYSPVSVKQKHLVNVDIDENQIASGATRTTIKFTVQENGSLSLETFHVSLSHSFKLDDRVPLNRVFIGAKRVQPGSHEFVLNWRDRHGMAWADYNGDKQLDVFITRGGYRGEQAHIPENFSD